MSESKFSEGEDVQISSHPGQVSDPTAAGRTGRVVGEPRLMTREKGPTGQETRRYEWWYTIKLDDSAETVQAEESDLNSVLH